MTVTIQLRGDTAANWMAANPVLAVREVGLETDSRKHKIGDGATPWSALPYAADGGSGGGSYTAGPGLKLTGNAFEVNFGADSGQVTEGNDPRLSDARTPTAHSHPPADVEVAGASPGEVLTVEGGAAKWAAPPGGDGPATPDATSTVKGKLRLAGDLGGTADTPTVPGLAAKAESTDARFPSADQKDALVGVGGTPSAANRFVVSTDYRLTNERTPSAHTHPPADVRTTGGSQGDVLTLDSGSARWLAPPGGGGTATPDATTSVKGKLRLAGALTGTADLPRLADGAIQVPEQFGGPVVRAGHIDTWNEDNETSELAGLVLTADGDGGASWEPASGGGPVVGPWQEVDTDSENGYENDWAGGGTFGLPDVRWRQEGDILRFSGVAIGGDAASDHVCTLPAAFRPTQLAAFLVAVSDDGQTFATGLGALDVDGAITIQGGPYTMVAFSGVTVELS